MNYTIVSKNGIQFITFEILNSIPFIKHGFSTRIGGVSQLNYNSLNLGVNTEDKENNVKENIKRFATAVEVDYKNMVLAHQVHSDVVKVVKEEDKGKGILKERDYKGIDGLVTNISNTPLMAIFADCVPIFFVDTLNKAIAITHAGWKGTSLKISQKTVQTMIKEYGSNPKEIIAVIGPSIGKCCYEVDNKVIEKFKKTYMNTSGFIFPKHDDKYQLDLWEANRIALEEIGLLNKNIIISNLCTSCNIDLFYSYRKEKGNTGRMGAIIQLK